MNYLYYPLYSDNDIKSILENGIMTDKYDEVVLYEKPYEKPVENAKKFAKINFDKLLEDRFPSSIYDCKSYEHNNTETHIDIPIPPNCIECIIDNKSKVSPGTIVRTILLALLFINQILISTGHNVINIDDGTVKELFNPIFTIIIGIDT